MLLSPVGEQGGDTSLSSDSQSFQLYNDDGGRFFALVRLVTVAAVEAGIQVKILQPRAFFLNLSHLAAASLSLSLSRARAFFTTVRCPWQRWFSFAESPFFSQYLHNTSEVKDYRWAKPQNPAQMAAEPVREFVFVLSAYASETMKGSTHSAMRSLFHFPQSCTV